MMKQLKILILSLFTVFSYGQTLDEAFPGAVGAGKYSRADVVYTHRIIDNLNDSGAGSFRDAYQSNSIISVNVSGLCLNTNITFANKENIIILGQTAPEGGFEYGGPGARFDYSKNIIWRYISFRNFWFGRDAVDFIGAENMMMDHISVSIGGDETMSFRASYTDTEVKNISVTNCHFNYGKTGMLLGDSGDLTKNGNLSCIGNLWAVISHRFPNANTHFQCDNIGNVIYDCSSRYAVTAGNLNLNDINNSYVDFGGNGARSQSRIIGYDPLIYTEGNINAGHNVGVGGDSWDLWQNRVYDYATEVDIFPLPLQYRTTTRHPLLNFDVADLQDADWWLNKAMVNKDVGNCARLGVNGERIQQIQYMDSTVFDRYEDGAIFNWTGALDYKIIPEVVEFQETTYPNNAGVVINRHDPALYTDTVSNAWITANGMTPATFDAMGHDLHATYTNIEMYSFGIDGTTVVSDIPVINIVGDSTIYLTVGDTYNELGANTNDNTDGVIPTVITGIQDQDTMSSAGTFYVYYNATDSDSNAAEQVVRAIVVSAVANTGGVVTPKKQLLTTY